MIKYCRIACLFISLLLINGQNSIAQKLQPGPQVLTFFSSVDDTEQPYGLYIPRNFDEQKQYPLVIMLHGAGSNHRLSLRRVFGKSNAEGETDVEASRYFPDWPDAEYIVASPYARGTAGYQGIPEKDVYDVLEDVKSRFSIDEDRIYLTGLSMGGGGTLWIGLSRPDIWAAIAPVCPAPPNGTEDLTLNALNLPVHFFHGEADPVVPVSVSRDWVKKLIDSGTKVEYQEYPGVQHDSWVNAYENGFVLNWFGQYKRNPFPDQVRFSSSRYKYSKAYWVQFDQLTPGNLAEIDVKFTGNNTLEASVSGLDAFTLRPSGHPKFNASQPVQMVINGKKLKIPAADSISLSLQKGKWSVGKQKPSATQKHNGVEGPMSEVVADSHIYVYGTGGNPSEQEINERRALATEAANWPVDRGVFLGRVMVFPRVLADKDVRPSDFEHSNLVLFGDKETNAIIARLNDALPLHLHSNSDDVGLAYIYPNNGRYVLISSGIPWWTGFQPKGISGLFPKQISSLLDLGDYILFKGNIENKIAAGNFNRDWKLAEGDVKKITATGVVKINE